MSSGATIAAPVAAPYAGCAMEPALEGTELGLASPSQAWLSALRSEGAERDRAIANLHALLMRAARFEVDRRRAALSRVRGEELEDIATQAADDALMAVLAKLDDFRGASRFTTWAYKFALLEAGVKLRRRAWQDREVVLEPRVGRPSPTDARARRRTSNRESCWMRCAMRSIVPDAAPATGFYRPWR